MTNPEIYAISILSENCQGVLRDVSEIMASHGANILLAQASVLPKCIETKSSLIYFEFEDVDDIDSLSSDLSNLEKIHSVKVYQPLSKIFGKRIIIVGGGAQVAQVAMGAVNEADRHNIRGERISVDTIPLVGEEDLASTVDAVSRLPRVSALVLAGSLMGGEISRSVEKIRSLGIPVISLKMAGSVTEHVDLVVTDPTQAGVFAVMHISSLAVFDINRIRGQEF